MGGRGEGCKVRCAEGTGVVSYLVEIEFWGATGCVQDEVVADLPFEEADFDGEGDPGLGVDGGGEDGGVVGVHEEEVEGDEFVGAEGAGAEG